MAGMAVLIAADLILAQPIELVGLVAIGVVLWGALQSAATGSSPLGARNGGIRPDTRRPSKNWLRSAALTWSTTSTIVA